MRTSVIEMARAHLLRGLRSIFFFLVLGLQPPGHARWPRTAPALFRWSVCRETATNLVRDPAETGFAAPVAFSSSLPFSPSIPGPVCPLPPDLHCTQSVHDIPSVCQTNSKTL